MDLFKKLFSKSEEKSEKSDNTDNSDVLVTISESDLPEPPQMTVGLMYRQERDSAAECFNKVSDVTYIDPTSGNIMSI